MNRRVDYTNLGGFPLDQDVLDHMQKSYRDAFGGLAKMAGDKVIIDGVVVDGGNVSSGWIVYNGEMIPFIGGAVNVNVSITEVATAAVFDDDTQHDIEFIKTATCAPLGAFPFADLVRLSTLQNMWQPGDLKQKVVDNAYITANFDVNGFGLNKEVGWRILDKAYPAAAGKMLVNRNAADGDFNTCGNNGGAKQYTLLRANLPAVGLKFPLPVTNSSGTQYEGNSMDGGGDRGLYRGNISLFNTTENMGNGTSFSMMNPYFVVLTLIKQ